MTGILWRRWRMILAVTLAGLTMSLVVARAWPPLYEAVARIQVAAPLIADPFGAPMTSRAAQSLQQIEQRLMTRENLAAMIDRHGLYADRVGLSIDARLALLRAAIRIESVAADSSAGDLSPAVSAVIIAARLPDPGQAARVANDMAQGFLDQGVADQALRSRDIIRFLTNEQARIGAELAARAALVPPPSPDAAEPPSDPRLTQLRSQYELITQRLAEAETTRRLEDSNQAERFVLLERAITPLSPVTAGGRWIVPTGTLAGLLLGLLASIAIERRDPVLRNQNRMARELDLMPMIAIPEIPFGKAAPRGLATRLLRPAPDRAESLVTLAAGAVIAVALLVLLV